MSRTEEKALTQLDVQIAEQRTAIWLASGTCVAIALVLLIGIPAVSAVLVPQAVVQCRSSIMAWRRMRDRRGLDIG